MVFSSLVFLFFYLAVVLLVYYIVPRKYRNFVLLLFSLLFYGWGEPVFITLMLFSTVSDYTFGRLIDRNRDNRPKARAFMIAAVAVNLALLGVFKYAGLLTDTLRILPPFSQIPIVTIPLPIGISFYTFQTMSYSIDVYRGDAPVQKNIIAFGTYVTLFPQLIAGPIVRYKDVAEQMEGRRENVDQFAHGVRLFLIGLGKKALLGNQMALLWDLLREKQDSLGILGAWLGITAFALHIYFDFGGYSDMARGLGNMLGFEFLKNFDYPYISRSISEFWRRWHISLGTWFREYVYIPLGGNRKGMPRTIRNLLIVWFLTGLWHGASWNYVLWGVYFGFLIMLERLFLEKWIRSLPRAFSHIYLLVLVLVSWVFFYFEDTAQMVHYLGLMFTLQNGVLGGETGRQLLGFLPLLVVAFVSCTPWGAGLYHRLEHRKGFSVAELTGALALLVLSTASLVSQSYNPFIYFRF